VLLCVGVCVCAWSGGCQCVCGMLRVYVWVEFLSGIWLLLFVGVAGRGVGLLCL